MSLANYIRVLIVDDHPAVREGLAELIAAQPDMRVAGIACDGAEAVALFQQLQPDVTLMDMRLPGLSGLEALRVIHRQAPQSRLIAMSSFQDTQTQALQAGATFFLLKELFGEPFLAAIRHAHVAPLVAGTEVSIPNQS